ncbi:MAG TPA: pyridoxal phosphate-dependent aminotransferase [Thermodesulfobacteriota bacterium]
MPLSGQGERHPRGLARPGVQALRASLIREVANAGAGRADVIPLWFGEPDQPTPDFITNAAAAALAEGRTFYAPNLGIPELREALAGYLTRLHRPVAAERICVTASGMNALMLVMECLIDPGDRVVAATPTWPNCLEVVHVMGGRTDTLALELAGTEWRIDLDRFLGMIDADTRAVLVNSPNNPTGFTMTREAQAALLARCRRLGVWLVADEVYDRIYYDGTSAPSFLDIAEPDDRVIVVNSFSKTWAMTGWRLGWITAPAPLMDDLAKLNEFNVSSAATFAQHAGVVAVREGEPFVAATLERYRRARDLVYERLGAFARVQATRPAGAFYAFFRVDGVTDSLAFAKRLLAETGVGLAPGVAFGPTGEGHLRLCFASSLERLEAALDRAAPALR